MNTIKSLLICETEDHSKEILATLKKEVEELRHNESLVQVQLEKLKADLEASSLRVESKELQNTQLQSKYILK